jgi:hypothetical protein
MAQDGSNRDWRQADSEFEPALILTWILGVALVAFLATTL